MKISKVKKGGKGVLFHAPGNLHNVVRVMPGNLRNPMKVRRRPYVVNKKNGQFLDVNRLITKDPAKYHIPLDDFIF